MSVEKMLIEAARRYELACQLPCMALDSHFEAIYKYDTTNHSSLCTCIMDAASIARIPCSHVHRYGCVQAIQYGGKYLYYCPMGLTHFIVPLVVHDQLMGSLVGGPVIIHDKEDYIRSAALEKYKNTQFGSDTLEMLAEQLPSVTPERITQLCEVLITLVNEIKTGVSAHIALNTAIYKDANELLSSGQYPLQTEKQLLTAIRVGNTDAALSQLSIWLEQLAGHTFSEVNSYCRDLCAVAARTAIESGADEVLTLENARIFINRLKHSPTLKDTSGTVSEMIATMSGYVYELSRIRHNDAVFKTLTYISEHYAESISLEDVATVACLSPSYFSKVFKDEMNVSFSQYLNGIRIEEGKKLLLYSNLPISEICVQAGFQEQSYFTKVFKRVTGITPMKFREQHKISS